MLKLAKTLKSNKFVFAWDSAKSKRRQLYPEYRLARRKQRQENPQDWPLLRRQFKEIRDKVLPQLGYKNIFLKTGYEADDIIASICLENEDEEIAIVSADSDLYQLLTENHFMWKLGNKKYTARDFRKQYEIEPVQWSLVKAIAGCSTDGVAGIEGVGEKRACKYLRGKLNGRYKNAILSSEGQKVIFANTSLVALPMLGTGSYSIAEDGFDEGGFVDVCNEYDFRSLKARRWEWVEVLGG